MSGIQTKVAAGASILALGGLAAYAVSSGAESTETEPAAKRQAVEVRTQTVHRTKRIVRHERPRQEDRGAASGDDRSGSAGPGSGAPSSSGPSAPGPAPAPAAPSRAATTPGDDHQGRGRGRGRGGDDDGFEHEQEHEAEHEQEHEVEHHGGGHD